MLLNINERKRWMDPSLVQDPAKLALQDENLELMHALVTG